MDSSFFPLQLVCLYWDAFTLNVYLRKKRGLCSVSSTNIAIKVSNASFSINRQEIFSDVSLIVPYGKIIGIIGRNGSGKTMLLRSIIGFAKICAGSVQVGEQVIGEKCEFAKDIGFIIDGQGFLPQYSGFHNLKLLASLKKTITDSNIIYALSQVGLDPVDKKKYHKYSKGMKQRLAIANALMSKPSILILDEPMNGLDQDCVIKMYALLKKLAADGCAILITSHYFEDITNLCDAYYEMRNGRLKPCYFNDTSFVAK